MDRTAPTRGRGRPSNSSRRSAAVNGLLSQTEEDSAESAELADPRAPDGGFAAAATRTRSSRKRRGFRRTGEQRYHVDTASIPKGMDYQWKRLSYLGKEDRENQIDTYENGFTPVPAQRHPELAGLDGAADGHIVREGLILVERPLELTHEARDEDQAAARALRKQQFRRLGLTPDNNLPRSSPKGSRSFEPIGDDGPDE